MLASWMAIAVETSWSRPMTNSLPSLMVTVLLPSDCTPTNFCLPSAGAQVFDLNQVNSITIFIECEFFFNYVHLGLVRNKTFYGTFNFPLTIIKDLEWYFVCVYYWKSKTSMRPIDKSSNIEYFGIEISYHHISTYLDIKEKEIYPSRFHSLSFIIPNYWHNCRLLNCINNNILSLFIL